jgi:hypothetical protein
MFVFGACSVVFQQNFLCAAQTVYVMEPDVPGGSGPLLGGKNASLLGSLKGGSTSLLGEPHYRGDKEVSCVGEGG